MHTGQPVGDGGRVGEQVGPGRGRVHFAAPVAGGQHEGARTEAGDVEHALPELLPGQVDRGHPGAPAHQGGQRSHLGAGAEDGHRVPVEAQPLGVVEHETDRVGDGRLDHAPGHPVVDLPEQRVAPQPLPVEGQRELGLRLRRTVQLGGAEAGRRLLLGPGLDRHVLVVLAHDHPAVQRGEPVVGDPHRRLRRVQPGLDEPAEVDEVAGAPVGLLLRGPRTRGVDRPERVRDDRAAHRRGAPAPVRPAWEDDPVRLVLLLGAHRPIMPARVPALPTPL